MSRHAVPRAWKRSLRATVSNAVGLLVSVPGHSSSRILVVKPVQLASFFFFPFLPSSGDCVYQFEKAMMLQLRLRGNSLPWLCGLLQRQSRSVRPRVLISLVVCTDMLGPWNRHHR